MKNINKTISALLLIVFLAIFLSCGDKSTSPVNNVTWGKDKVEFNVEWTDNTVYFDSTQLGALKKEDAENHIYTFYANDTKAASLQEGNILVIHGKAMRKITSVTNDGSEIIVETEEAALIEAIKNGKIAWDVGIDFNKVARNSYSAKKGHDIPLNPMEGDTIIDVTFESGAYTFEVFMLYQDEQYGKVKLSCEKKIGGSAKGKFTAEGTLKRFRSKNEIDIENQKITKMDYQNYDMKGDLTLSLVVTASANDNLTLELPVQLLPPIPISAALPIFLNLKVLFLVNGSVPLDGSAQVTAKFNYSSAQGFKFNGLDASVDAQVGDYKMEKNIAQTGASSAVGINFGLAFPRLEVSVGGEVLVPWIHTAFLIGGTYTFTPACQTADAAFIGACGVSINAFELFKYSKTLTLWDYRKNLLKSGDCP
jgi:hypothetical protein